MTKTKAVAPLAIVAIFSLIAIEFLILQVGFKDVESMRRTAREASIVESINTVELTKVSLQQALDYSFYQASYDVSKTGGKKQTQPKNGISYWRSSSSTFYSFNDFKKDLQDTTLNLFNEYAVVLNDSVKIPKYIEVEVSKTEDDVVSVNAKSGEKLRLDAEKLQVSDSANVSEKIRIRTIKLFEIGETNFLKSDKFGEIASQAVSGCGCGSSGGQIKSKAESGLSSLQSSLSSSGVKVEFLDRNIGASAVPKMCKSCSTDSKGKTTCSSYCCGATCTASIDTRVKMTDSVTYPVYDGKDTGMKNLILQFYVVSGASASG